jgi:hypothetical protein
MPYGLSQQTGWLKQRTAAYNELSVWLVDSETGTDLEMQSCFIWVN